MSVYFPSYISYSGALPVLLDNYMAYYYYMYYILANRAVADDIFVVLPTIVVQ